MRNVLSPLLAVVLAGCGVSTLELERAGSALRTEPGPMRSDAGTPSFPEVPDCQPGQTVACETSCGSTGTLACIESHWATTCDRPVERCTGDRDDDCDGLVDAADPDCQVCTPGQSRPCTTSCGSGGTGRCGGDGQWETGCSIPAEVCGNGVDDDCDGQADSTDSNCWTCTPGHSRSCTTSCGGGTERCTPGGQWETTCRPPSESCDNGADDDCDGKVDHHDPDCPVIIHTCEGAEGGGCNGDLGYGDHCAAADNSGGCSAGRFFAWCNRRNTAYPNIWDNWVHDWVSSRCDGTTSETGTQYSTWYCTASSNDRYECTTPLVLSFDGAPVGLAAPDAPFAFTPGEAVYSSWPRPATPWLVRDLNRNGLIEDGSELFGSNTRLPDGSLAAHGFAALAALDDNHDGVVDRADLGFGSLRLWSDLDGDRRTDPGELRTLPAAGVASLGVGFTLEPRCDHAGNCERERAAFTWSDKAGRRHTGAVVDLYLAITADPRLSCAETWGD